MYRFLAVLWVVSVGVLAEPTVDFIRENAVEIVGHHSLPSHIYHQVRDFKVLAVGEIHGTKEGPEFVVQLLRTLNRFGKSVLLALEIPADVQAAVDLYRQSGDIDFLSKSPFFLRPYQDGRSSRAMARLLGKTRGMKNVSVSCFDPTNASGGQDRDEKRHEISPARIRPARLTLWSF